MHNLIYNHIFSVYFLLIVNITFTLVGCGSTSSPALHQNANTEADTKKQNHFTNIYVEARLSSTTYHTLKAKEDKLEVYIKNLSEEPVMINPGNKLQNVLIYGQGKNQRFPLKLNFYHLPDGVNTEAFELSAGAEVILFELTFEELFEEYRYISPRNRDPRWIWDWEAATMAPSSPVHDQEGFQTSAEIWVTIVKGVLAFSSDKVKIEIVE